MKTKHSVILANLGTPDSPSVPDVRRYLGEFLMDPRIINIPKVLRWLLVNGIILRFRPKKSAAAYKKVWTEEGSPLLVHGKNLQAKVQKLMKGRANVHLAMRYGNPSMEDTVEKSMEDASGELIVFPLYPQYAAATTGSTVEKMFRVLDKKWNVPPMTVVKDFYQDPRFIEAVGVVAKEHLENFKPDHVLFSYHGLPESHLKDTAKRCLQQKNCCDSIAADNRYCYRAQCVATTRSLAEKLDLSKDQYSLSFQSRLGRAEWVKPYTTDLIEELAKKGVKRLAVLCPAFVADCLETIEEIGMEAKADFIAAGGEDLYLVPCVNSSDVWAEAVVAIVEDYLPKSTFGRPD